jgi:Zn-dependent protease with chaperone function
MSEGRYDIVFDGEILAGQKLSVVTDNIARLLKIQVEQARKLLHGKSITIKSGVTEALGKKYIDAFARAGVVCQLVPIQKQTSSVEDSENALILSKEGQAGTTISIEDVERAITGSIPKFNISFAYQAGLMLTGVCLALLLLIYLIGVVGLANSTYSHAVENIAWLTGGESIFPQLFYVLFLLAGSAAVILFLKPFLAPPYQIKNEITLDINKERKLYTLVQLLALHIGAPTPNQIKVICEPRINIKVENVLLGMQRRDLVMEIGLPLIGGMSAKQLAGRIAHELAYFVQKYDMGFGYLIEYINRWLYRCVYFKDEWDVRLEKTTRRYDDTRRNVFIFVQWLIWLSRKAISILMSVAALISRYISRQMEFDSDMYEAYISGSEEFRKNTYRLRALEAGHSLVEQELLSSWKEEDLSADLIALIIEHADTLASEIEADINDQIVNAEAGLFDVHPSDSERVAMVENYDISGLLNLEVMGTVLLSDFKNQCKHVTLHCYRDYYGIEVDKERLVNRKKVGHTANTRERETAGDVLEEYSEGLFRANRFVIPSLDIILSGYGQQYKVKLQNTIIKLQQHKQEYKSCYEEYNQILEKLFVVAQARALVMEDIDVLPSAYYLHFGMVHDVDEAWESLNELLEEITSKLDTVERLMRLRYGLVLNLVRDSGPAFVRTALERYIPFLKNLARAYESATNLHILCGTISTIESLSEAKDDAYYNVLTQYLQNAYDQYERFLDILAKTPYPFYSAADIVTTADYVVQKIGHPDEFIADPDDIVTKSNQIMETVYSLHLQSMSKIANIAHRVEDQLGLFSLTSSAEQPYPFAG